MQTETGGAGSLCTTRKLLVAITETWWSDSHSWNPALGGCIFFGKDRPRRRGGGVVLCVAECFGCFKLNYGDSWVECLWVRIRREVNKADIMMGVLDKSGSRGRENIVCQNHYCYHGGLHLTTRVGLSWILGKESSPKEF